MQHKKKKKYTLVTHQIMHHVPRLPYNWKWGTIPATFATLSAYTLSTCNHHHFPLVFPLLQLVTIKQFPIPIAKRAINEDIGKANRFFVLGKKLEAWKVAKGRKSTLSQAKQLYSVCKVKCLLSVNFRQWTRWYEGDIPFFNYSDGF